MTTPETTYITRLRAQARWAQIAQDAAMTRASDQAAWRATIRALAAEGAPQALIARAAGLSRARINQIVRAPLT